MSEEFQEVSDGGLRIMENHLDSALDRIDRCADQNPDIDMSSITEDDMGHKLSEAKSQILDVCVRIQQEKQRRQSER